VIIVDEDNLGEALTIQKLIELQQRMWLFLYRNPILESEAMLREQLRSMEQFSRLGSAIAIPTMVYMVWRLVAEASIEFIVIGLGYLAFALFMVIQNHLSPSKVDDSREEVFRSIRRIKIKSVIHALGYSSMVAIPIAFGQLDSTSEMFVVALGTIIVGGFVYGSVPRAQTLFIGLSVISFALGFLLGGGASAIEATVLLVFFSACTDYVYRLFFFNFAQRHMQSEKLKENSETVRLLLNDYAEQSSDWLWQLDAQGNIVNASRRFADAAGQGCSILNKTHLTGLFEDSIERNALAKSLDAKSAFRGLVLPLEIDGDRRWWKLSGRPVDSGTDTRIQFRGVATDITISKKAEDRVAHLAHFDSLTDLPNRALFNESLQRSIHRLRDGQILAVMYLDLDNFKLINDTLGHGAGDAVLRAVASRLEQAIGIEDVVCRLGGDEFAISLRSIESFEQAEQMAKSIIDSIGKPIMIEGQPVSSGISIGMALCPQHGDNAETLLRHADIALYRTKSDGRGSYTIFSSGMREEVEGRRDIELELRAAVQCEQLELHYQPLINVESQETVGYEALLRWTHPERGMIPPDQFVPIAEECGLIVPLGEWVIRTALWELKNWPVQLSVSVNLSPVQMRSDNLIPTIVNALAATGVDPARLELEITETVLMSDSQTNVELLHKIRSLGVRVALDDFGTGYSSLNYLRSFPFDKIKIDRCFVDDVESREDCRAIIRAVTGLASSLGMVTTAEGVESDDQLKRLRAEGCEQVQGYLFSKAVPAELIEGRVAPVRGHSAPVRSMSPENKSDTGSNNDGNNRNAA
jgi:diguanylate cyclase (GGDEF)-like protein/PAS domain S-box-containing protein